MFTTRCLIAVSIMVGALYGCAADPGHRFNGPDMHTLAKPDMPPCKTNNDCRIAVYASIGPNGECNVQVLFDKITVAQKKYPKVVWRIEVVDPDGDDYDYRFKLDTTVTPPVYGIEIIGNDPALDFEDPGYDQGSRKFKWQSKHLRNKSFDYKIHVERRLNNRDRWVDCLLLDPRIVNE